MGLQVLEAVNSKGKKYPANKLAKQRVSKMATPYGQQSVSLDKAHFPGDRIAKLRVRGYSILRTGTTVFEFKTLAHKKPVTRVQSGVMVTVSPVAAAKRLGKDIWELPVRVRTSYECPVRISGFAGKISLFADDGKELSSGNRSGSHGRGVHTMKIRIPPHSMDPASTRMVIECPTGLKVVPYELTFKNVRIKDVPPRKPKP